MAGGETSVLHPPHRGQPLCTMYQGFYFKGFPAAFRSHFPRSVRTKPTSCQAQVGSWTCPSLHVANQVGRGSHVPWGGPGVAGWDLKPQCPSGNPVTACRGFLQPPLSALIAQHGIKTMQILRLPFAPQGGQRLCSQNKTNPVELWASSPQHKPTRYNLTATA